MYDTLYGLLSVGATDPPQQGTSILTRAHECAIGHAPVRFYSLLNHTGDRAGVLKKKADYTA